MSVKNKFSMEIPSWLRAKHIYAAAVLAVVLAAAMTSYFVVDQKEQSVVLLLGRQNRMVEPGLHFKMPFGIEKNYNVPTQVVLKEEFGFRTDVPGVTSIRSSTDYPGESIMLTGDLNIVDIEWIIQYRIVDAHNWLFKVQEKSKIIRDISQSVINQLVGDRAIFDVIGPERENIEFQGRDMMNVLFKKYELGIKVSTVKLLNIVPPVGTVQAAFEDVNKAIQDRNRLINEGQETYNQAIPKSKGQAEQIRQEAEGYAVKRVNNAEGDVARYLKILDEYNRNPGVTRTRLYYEMFEKTFAAAQDVDLIDKSLRNFVPFKAMNGTPSSPEGSAE